MLVMVISKYLMVQVMASLNSRGKMAIIRKVPIGTFVLWSFIVSEIFIWLVT